MSENTPEGNQPRPDSSDAETQYIPPQRPMRPADPTKPLPQTPQSGDPTQAFTRPAQPQQPVQPPQRPKYGQQPIGFTQPDATRQTPYVPPQPNANGQQPQPNYRQQNQAEEPTIVVPQAPYAAPPNYGRQPTNYGQQPNDPYAQQPNYGQNNPYAPPPQPERYAAQPAYDRSPLPEPQYAPERAIRREGLVQAPLLMGLGALLVLLIVIAVIFLVNQNKPTPISPAAATATANGNAVQVTPPTLSQVTLVPTLPATRAPIVPGSVPTVTPPVIAVTATPVPKTAAATSAAPVVVTTAPVTVVAPTTAPAPTAAATAEPTTAPTAASGTTAPTTPLPTVPANAQDLATFQQIEKEVSTERGLPLKKDVPISVISTDTSQKFFDDVYTKDTPQSDRDLEKNILVALHFVESGFDLDKAESTLHGGLVLGFYENKTNHFYIVNNGDANQSLATALNRGTAAHEMTHALQNQTYDLEKFQPDQTKQPLDQHNDDMAYARLGVVEGDAETSRTLWQQQHFTLADQADYLRQQMAVGSSTDLSAIEALPYFLLDQLEFPYTTGAQFVTRLYQQDGWNKVNVAWTSHIPQSTTELLHPEKYQQGFKPQSVSAKSVASALGSDWKTLDINVLGELQMREWLQMHGNSATVAATAAAGWLGDRYEVLQGPNGALGTIIDSVWESGKDADEFTNATATWATNVVGTQQTSGTDNRRYFSSDTLTVVIARKGNNVAVSIWPTSDLADKALAARNY